jgi:ComEC/Rec2-related protein
MADFFIRPGDAAFAVAIGFIAGILAASFAWPIFIPLVVFVSTGVFVFVVSRKKKFLYGTLFSCAAITVGAYYFYVFTNVRSATIHLPDATSGVFRVIVSKEPVSSENYLSFRAELQPPFSGALGVFAPPASDVRYGDLVSMSGAIGPPRSAGELPAIFPKRLSVISQSHGFWLTEKLLSFKEAINRKFGEFLSQDEAALQGGMTLGGTSGMSVTLKNEMAASETLYVTSMYGYKIAMTVAVMEMFLAGLIPRHARFCIAGGIIVTFVFMSGGNVSAIRGGMMACVLMLAKETGSVFSKRNALALIAAGMALLDPTAVAQAGFSFSFASVAGIALLVEPFRKFLRLGEGRGIFRWKEAVLLSVASLAPIIPLVSAIYGSFSLTAVLANVLVAPTIPLGMATGAALAIAGFVSPYLAFFVARAAGVVLNYALFVIHFFATHVAPLPFSFSSAMPFLLYYAALGLFAYTYREHGT